MCVTIRAHQKCQSKIMPKNLACLVCCVPIKRTSLGNKFYCVDCKPFVLAVQVEATLKVANAISKGLLKKQSDCVCNDCGIGAQIYDHRRYLRPLEVEPLCQSCNGIRGAAIDIKEAVQARMPKQSQFSLQAFMDTEERAKINEALEGSHWNRTKAAKALGISFRSMRYRMDRLQIE